MVPESSKGAGVKDLTWFRNSFVEFFFLEGLKVGMTVSLHRDADGSLEGL